MKKIKGVLGGLAALALASSAGCASIVSKSEYPVIINSSPSGATVTIRDEENMEIHKAITPSTVYLSAKEGYFRPADYSLYFEKEGYKPATFNLSAGIDPWYAGNILFGFWGLIGFLGIDPATGAMWKLDDRINMNLREQS